MTPGAAGTASYHYRGETVAQDETDAVARLAEMLPETLGPVGFRTRPVPQLGIESELTGYGEVLIAALLPVVRELGDLRAAEELEAAAADETIPDARRAWRPTLRARAAALRGEAGR